MVAALISCKLEEYKEVYEPSRVVLCGGFLIDVIAKSKQFIQDNYNIGDIEVIPGGCIRNVLECLLKLGVKDCLALSSVGNDIFGKLLKEWMKEHELTLRGVYTSDKDHTALYTCIMNEGLATGVADMNVLANIPLSHLKKFAKNVETAKVLVIDSNLSIENIEWLCEVGKNAIIAFDPISEEKSKKLIVKNLIGRITLLKGNIKQFIVIANCISGSTTNDKLTAEELIELIFKHTKTIKDCRLKYVVVTKENEVVCGYLEETVQIIKKLGEKIGNEKIVKTGGAGDAFMGGFIYGLLKGNEIEKNIEIGMKCALLSILSKFNINPQLSLTSIT
jgi:adenosine kinase